MITLPETEIPDDTSELLAPDPDKQEVRFPALRVTQPIGDMFLASIPHTQLIRISRFDVRRIMRVERDFETYLGIQRPVDPKRREQLEIYVNFKDASFPGAVIIAIDANYANFDEKTKEIVVRNWADGDEFPTRNIGDIARVIDGQHRIAGLEEFSGLRFDVPVTIFVGADIADQAYVFSTVNLEQTKVNKSLSYDLFALARSRSPQKTCHNIAVALDSDEDSAFSKKIKRLGFARHGGNTETLTQATFVEMLMRLISKNPKIDRDLLLRGKPLERVRFDKSGMIVFRDLFIDEKDVQIAENVNNYFLAIAGKWPTAWRYPGAGNILGRTNGFRALMRILPSAYRYWHTSSGDVVSQEKYSRIFESIEVDDEYFSIERFVPGTSGEAKLIEFFMSELTFLP